MDTSRILTSSFKAGQSAEGRKRALIRLALISAIAVALIASIVVVSSSTSTTDADPEVIRSGGCGKNIGYKHYSDGSLEITGSGSGRVIDSPNWKDVGGKTWYGPGNGNYYAGSLTVTLDPNDGSPATTKAVTYGQTYGDLPASASGGKTFAGWFTEQFGGSEVKADTKVMYVDSQTLYAHWNRNPSEIIPNRGREPPFPFLLRSNFYNRIAMGLLGSL